MNKAMNLTYGDLILLEIALVTYLKDIDLSLESGTFISELIGKIEYQLAQLKLAANEQLAPGLQPLTDISENQR